MPAKTSAQFIQLRPRAKLCTAGALRARNSPHRTSKPTNISSDSSLLPNYPIQTSFHPQEEKRDHSAVPGLPRVPKGLPGFNIQMVRTSPSSTQKMTLESLIATHMLSIFYHYDQLQLSQPKPTHTSSNTSLPLCGTGMSVQLKQHMHSVGLWKTCMQSLLYCCTPI